jgi:hypothetical protein
MSSDSAAGIRTTAGSGSASAAARNGVNAIVVNAGSKPTGIQPTDRSCSVPRQKAVAAPSSINSLRLAIGLAYHRHSWSS